MKRKKYPKDNRLSYRRFYYKRYMTLPKKKELEASLRYDYTKCNVERVAHVAGWKITVIGHYSEYISEVNRKMRKK